MHFVTFYTLFVALVVSSLAAPFAVEGNNADVLAPYCFYKRAGCVNEASA